MRQNNIKTLLMLARVVFMYFLFKLQNCLRRAAKNFSDSLLPQFLVKIYHERFRCFTAGFHFTYFVIDLKRLPGTNAYLNAVKVVRQAALQGHHLPEMRKIMLQTWCWTGNFCKSHGHTRQYQALHHCLNHLWVSIRQARCRIHNLLKGVSHEFSDVFAVIFTSDQMRDTPFADGDIFGEHVSQSCPQHPVRRIFHNIRIGNDRFRAGIIQRNLYAAHNHWRRIRCIAIHGRSRSYNDWRAANGMSQYLAGIVNYTRTDP